jgi:hypothetical protein
MDLSIVASAVSCLGGLLFGRLPFSNVTMETTTHPLFFFFDG